MTRPISIYIHIPFCVRKCGYCDFYSIESPANLERYLHCCEIELADVRKRHGRRNVASIYFGGGTPSVADPEGLVALIGDFVRKGEMPEITIEANPNSFSVEKFKIWTEGGINRLSLGIQSFDNGILQALGRLHNARQGVAAFHSARKAGCENIGIDLMFGIPGQTLRLWNSSLAKAVDLKPEHISVYGLTVVEGTALHASVESGKQRLPHSEIYNRMFYRAHEVLTAAGYEHYEISNYALPGFRSRHNSRYWEGEDCAGVGAAAHSQHGPNRWANFSNVKDYCTAMEKGECPLAWQERVSSKAKLTEAIMLGLRTVEGASLDRLAALGFKKDRSPIIDSLVRANMVLVVKDRLALTLQGMMVADEIIGRLIE